MPKYQWAADGPKWKVEAGVFGAALELLAKGADIGIVPPKDIVEYARPANSPIHLAFTWDRDKAHEKWLLEEARQMARSIQVVYVRTGAKRMESSKAFFSVRSGDTRGYASQEKIKSSADLTQQVIDSARRELSSYVLKFQFVAGFGSYVPRLRQIIDEMQAQIDAVADQAKQPRRQARPSKKHDSAMAIAAE